MTPEQQLEIAIQLGVAALAGLTVGIEREWSAKAPGETRRFAGVRTFLLIGLLGGLAAELIRFDLLVAGTIILAASALLILVAYAMSVRGGDLDSTTEFAAVLVLAAGVLAGSGHLAIASSITAFTALVLVEKTRIHSMVYRIQSDELAAGFRFAVLALVVLPLLPEGPYGPPPGIRPRELWAMVLLFSGVSFAAYIARRAAGAERGYRLAGLLGGLISSTLVTLNFSRESRSQPKLGHALASGVIAACTVLPVRVGLLTTVLNPAVGIAAIPYLLIPFVIGLLFVLLAPRKEGAVKEKAPIQKSPLRLWSAIQMVIAFQAALYVLKWVSQRFGSTGIMGTAAVVGLTDVDTLTFMMARQSDLPNELAAQALIVGVLSNTLLKLALALLIGSGRFRVVAGAGLIALAIGTGIGLFFF